MLTLAVAVLTFTIIFVPLALLVARNIVRVPPDSLLVITGRKRTIENPETGEPEVVGYRTLRSGAAFQVPFLERSDVLDLTEHSLEPTLCDVADADGALHPVTIHARARASVEVPHLKRAIERLLSLSADEVRQIIANTIESRVRSEVAAFRLHNGVDWGVLSDRLRVQVADDLARIGVELDSFAIAPESAASKHTMAAVQGVDAQIR